MIKEFIGQYSTWEEGNNPIASFQLWIKKLFIHNFKQIIWEIKEMLTSTSNRFYYRYN